MALSSLQLDAFVAVSTTGSFSAAARKLHISQSALSHRVINLEEVLGVTLFIRDPAGVRLTELGASLLRYCKIKQRLEDEFLSEVSPQGKSLAGIVRIAGISTAIRSLVTPALMELVNQNGDLQVETRTDELRQLPHLLRSGEVDYIVTYDDHAPDTLHKTTLGIEENVLVESAKKKSRKDVYLDHDAEDETTKRFFAWQRKRPEKLKRSFFDEIYAIVDAVEAGIGRAVVPRHLIAKNRNVQVVPGFKPLKLELVFCHYDQPYFPMLHDAVVKVIESKVPELLSDSRE